MLKSGGGSIINTSSMYGVGAFNRQPAYGVSKAGINMLTEYVATAFGKKGVRCNAVAPSMISTPLLRSFIPEELVKLNEDRSEERRVGKECVRTCRSRRSPYHYKKKTK